MPAAGKGAGQKGTWGCGGKGKGSQYTNVSWKRKEQEPSATQSREEKEAETQQKAVELKAKLVERQSARGDAPMVQRTAPPAGQAQRQPQSEKPSAAELVQKSQELKARLMNSSLMKEKAKEETSAPANTSGSGSPSDTIDSAVAGAGAAATASKPVTSKVASKNKTLSLSTFAKQAGELTRQASSETVDLTDEIIGSPSDELPGDESPPTATGAAALSGGTGSGGRSKAAAQMQKPGGSSSTNTTATAQPDAVTAGQAASSSAAVIARAPASTTAQTPTSTSTKSPVAEVAAGTAVAVGSPTAEDKMAMRSARFAQSPSGTAATPGKSPGALAKSSVKKPSAGDASPKASQASVTPVPLPAGPVTPSGGVADQPAPAKPEGGPGGTEGARVKSGAVTAKQATSSSQQVIIQASVAGSGDAGGQNPGAPKPRMPAPRLPLNSASNSVVSPATAKPNAISSATGSTTPSVRAQVSTVTAPSPAAPQLAPTAKPSSNIASQDASITPKDRQAVEKASGNLPQSGTPQASSSQVVPKQASGSQEGHVPKATTASSAPAVPAKASSAPQAPPSRPAKRTAEANRAAGEPDRKVLRSSQKMRPLARALGAMSRPPRKRPRLLANDSGDGPVKEWEAEFLWLSSWMDTHASKYRLNSKAVGPSQTPLPDAQQDSKLDSLSKYLKDQSAAA